jgi:hypothetical protein
MRLATATGRVWKSIFGRAEADVGMAALIDDRRERGRLDSTLVIWMGELGRTPQITSGGGRNHWARAWSTVLAVGVLRGPEHGDVRFAVFGSHECGQ